MAKVLVVLGVKQIEGGLMPATVTRLGKASNPSYQYLSKEQLDAMGQDQTAIWEAQWVDKHWWLETRYPNGPLVAEAEKQWREPVEFDPREIPF
jgi:hypothetical protein